MKEKIKTTLKIIHFILVIFLFFSMLKIKKELKTKDNSIKNQLILGEKRLNYLEYESLSDKRMQKELFATIKKMLDHSYSEDKIKESLYLFKIENASNNFDLSLAYENLALFYLEKNTPLHFFKAIDGLNRAINIEYSTERAEILSALSGGLVKSSDIGVLKKEIFALEQMLQRDLSTIQELYATLRLSFLLKQGRASSLEKNKNLPKMKEAFELQKKALTLIPVEESNLKKINIAFCVDDKYAPHAMATICSILVNSYPDTFHKFHFVMDGKKPLSDENQEKLKKLSALKDSDFSFHLFPEDILFKFEQNQCLEKYFGRFPQIVLYRLFFDQIFPNEEKMLYLDTDIIVNSDLQMLYSKDLEGKPVAGVRDIFKISLLNASKKNSIYFFDSLISSNEYINSGVVLFDLNSWKSRNLSEKALDWLKNIDRKLLLLPDQNILNKTAENMIFNLSTRWNFWNFERSLYGMENEKFEFWNFEPSLYGMENEKFEFITHNFGEKKAWNQKNQNDDLSRIDPSFWPYWSFRELAENQL